MIKYVNSKNKAIKLVLIIILIIGIKINAITTEYQWNVLDIEDKSNMVLSVIKGEEVNEGVYNPKSFYVEESVINNEYPEYRFAYTLPGNNFKNMSMVNVGGGPLVTNIPLYIVKKYRSVPIETKYIDVNTGNKIKETKIEEFIVENGPYKFTPISTDSVIESKDDTTGDIFDYILTDIYSEYYNEEYTFNKSDADKMKYNIMEYSPLSVKIVFSGFDIKGRNVSKTFVKNIQVDKIYNIDPQNYKIDNGWKLESTKSKDIIISSKDIFKRRLIASNDKIDKVIYFNIIQKT